jgi:hypothetical protein
MAELKYQLRKVDYSNYLKMMMLWQPQDYQAQWITSPTNMALPATNTSTGGSMDMSTTNALLNQLISNISALSNRPVQIVIGGRVVDEIKAQADLNSTYVVGAG